MFDNLLPWRRPKNYVTTFGTQEKKLGVLRINGKMKTEMVKHFQSNYQLQGDHIENGGKASPAPILTLLSGAGTLAASNAASGSLFMATANPATLMSIGNGVGSAVIGSSGKIIAQAPFVAAGSSIMAVAGPMLAFQCISTISLLNKLSEVKEGIKTLQRGVENILHRQEATYIGEILSAANRLERLEQEFGICNRFTTDMIIRMALLEDCVNPIFERFTYLYNEGEKIGAAFDITRMNEKKSDAGLLILLSMLDLRLDVLRVKLAIQENPGFVETYSKSLSKKIERYEDIWKNVDQLPDEVEKLVKELETENRDMNFWQRNVPGFLFGKRNEHMSNEVRSKGLKDKVLHSETKALRDAVSEAINIGDILKSQVGKLTPMSLFYWQDELGTHSYYTNDILVN
jgi:hypothetical protein